LSCSSSPSLLWLLVFTSVLGKTTSKKGIRVVRFWPLATDAGQKQRGVA
jgi:hypothetical protein